MNKLHTGIDGNQIDDADNRASEVARQLHSVVQKVCLSALAAAAKNPVHAMMILSQAASGILHLLAKTTVPEGTEDLPVNSTAALFSALLSYHTAPCEYEPGKVTAEFSPLVIYDALKDMEKLNGQQPDEHLNAVMCRVARRCAADPKIVAEIARDRAAVHRDGATLN